MTTTDPVCGMTVDPAAGPPSLEHQGRRYYFCCAHCMQRFAEAPEQWLDSRPAPEATAPATQGSGYTCPMHPEVVQDEPGTCPHCGMALEPIAPAAADGPNPELTDFRGGCASAHRWRWWSSCWRWGRTWAYRSSTGSAPACTCGFSSS